MITNRYLACLTEWETNSCKSNTQRFLTLWVILKIYHFFCYYIFHLVRALCLVNLAIVFHFAKFKSLLELEHFPQIEPSDLINIALRLTSFSGPYWKLRSPFYFRSNSWPVCLFFQLVFMARMLRPLAIKLTGKNSICNLQYGARTRSAKGQPKETGQCAEWGRRARCMAKCRLYLPVVRRSRECNDVLNLNFLLRNKMQRRRVLSEPFSPV